MKDDGDGGVARPGKGECLGVDALRRADKDRFHAELAEGIGEIGRDRGRSGAGRSG